MDSDRKVAGSDVVGLIPAAGRATRISPLPCSKEVYPIGIRHDGSARPKVVSQYLLDKMRLAGITRVYFVLGAGKWDIPAYFGDGSTSGMHFAYLTLEASPGVPFTLDHAYPFVRDAKVAFGFPDILFKPDLAFLELMTRHAGTQADIVLGLCPAGHARTYDRVQFHERTGIVDGLILKPEDERFPYSWAIALWTPRFTEFLHDYAIQNKPSEPGMKELTAGHAIQASIEAGLRVQAAVLSEEPYLDIGTPGDLRLASRLGADGLL